MLYKAENISLDYFCSECMKSGHPVERDWDRPDELYAVKPIQNHNSEVVGIIMDNVVKFNPKVYNNSVVYEGGKVRVIISGWIAVQTKRKLPVLQPIYYDYKKQKYTWKKLGPYIGYTDSNVDADGFVKVKLDF